MVITPKHNRTLKNKSEYLKVKQSCKCPEAVLLCCVEQKHPYLAEMKTSLVGPILAQRPPLPIGQKFPPPQKRASTHQHLKICKSQQLEPQLILCYKDCKGHHFPDIHNKGINREEKCIK